MTDTQSDKTVEEILESYGNYERDYMRDQLHDTPHLSRPEAIAALTARENRMVQEAVDKTHYTLLERFNKGDEDAGKDIYINVDSDSWHVLIKEIKAQLTNQPNRSKE